MKWSIADEANSADLVVIISVPTRESGIIVLSKRHREILVNASDDNEFLKRPPDEYAM